MKILTKKKVESLFDDIMTLNLIASESIKLQVMNERPDIKDLIRTQRLITERCANAVCTLMGMFGLLLAREIQTKYNDGRMKEMLKNEAVNDMLDKL